MAGRQTEKQFENSKSCVVMDALAVEKSAKFVHSQRSPDARTPSYKVSYGRKQKEMSFVKPYAATSPQTAPFVNCNQQ